MKGTLALTVAALLFSGASLVNAAGAEKDAAAQGAGEEVTPSVGESTPITEHQSKALKEEKQRFSALDENDDGRISYEEAQQSETLSSYWQQQGLGSDAQMDRAEFAQFVSTVETGSQIYDGDREFKGIPDTKHQEEVTREGQVVNPAAPDPGDASTR